MGKTDTEYVDAPMIEGKDLQLEPLLLEELWYEVDRRFHEDGFEVIDLSFRRYN